VSMPTQTDSVRSDRDSSSASADAQAKAQEFAGRAQEQAEAVAGQTQDRIREQVDQRSTQLGERINGQASDLRSVSEALRDQGKDRPAQTVDRLVGYAEQAGDYLHANDADSMLSDAENFGREKPAAVAVGALAIGFLASRFLKASSGRRYASRDTSQKSSSPTGLPVRSPDVPVAPPTSEQAVAVGSSPALPGI
jgi:hypothetical protein